MGLFLVLAAPPFANADPQRPEPVLAVVAQPSPDEPALADFQDAVTQYLGLRDSLRNEIPPLTLTTRAADLKETSDALAGAIQRARRSARQGAFFTPAVARVMRQRLQQALRGLDVARVF